MGFSGVGCFLGLSCDWLFCSLCVAGLLGCGGCLVRDWSSMVLVLVGYTPGHVGPYSGLILSLTCVVFV